MGDPTRLLAWSPSWPRRQVGSSAARSSVSMVRARPGQPDGVDAAVSGLPAKQRKLLSFVARNGIVKPLSAILPTEKREETAVSDANHTPSAAPNFGGIRASTGAAFCKPECWEWPGCHCLNF